MNSMFVELRDDEISNINGGSITGWGTIAGGVSLSISAVVTIATAPLSAGACVAVAGAFLLGKTAAAIGLGEVCGAIKY